MLTMEKGLSTSENMDGDGEPVIKYAGFLSSLVNILNTIIGAGILAMPYAMSLTGVFVGVISLFFSAIVTAFGLYLLACSAAKLERGKASFNSISALTFPSFASLLDLSVGILCFGAATSYLILIGDVMPQIVSIFNSQTLNESIVGTRYFWITLFVCIIAPFTLLRRLDSFRYISIISMVSISYVILLIIIYFFRKNIWNTNAKAYFFKGKGAGAFFSSVSIYTFAYTCHQNMFIVVNEIRDNSRKKITQVIITSVAISSIAYLIVALLGYLSVGANVPGNIILAYGNSAATTISRIAIVILILFSYPLQIYPTRVSFDKVLMRYFFSFKIFDKLSYHSNLRFYALTFLIVVLSYVLAMTIHSFEKVLEYVGSMGATMISFILPGLYYSKLAYSPDVLYCKESPDSQEGQGVLPEVDRRRFGKTWFLKTAAIALVVYGVLIAIISLVSNILNSIKG